MQHERRKTTQTRDASIDTLEAIVVASIDTHFGSASSTDTCPTHAHDTCVARRVCTAGIATGTGDVAGRVCTTGIATTGTGEVAGPRREEGRSEREKTRKHINYINSFRPSFHTHAKSSCNLAVGTLSRRWRVRARCPPRSRRWPELDQMYVPTSSKSQ